MVPYYSLPTYKYTGQSGIIYQANKIREKSFGTSVHALNHYYITVCTFYRVFINQVFQQFAKSITTVDKKETH